MDPLAQVSPVLAGLVGASVQGRVALGPRVGARVQDPLAVQAILAHLARSGAPEPPGPAPPAGG